MSEKPRLLDLFCGAGGVAKGYQRAGFYVVGVDIEPQPNYCGDEFHQADALKVLARLLRGEEWNGYALADFTVVHASPPCQGYTSMNRRFPETRAQHPRLIAPTRELLCETDLPYVIENVPAARDALVNPTQLCGSSFGLKAHRHRLFETSFPFLALQCAHNGSGAAVYGKLDGRRLWTRTDGSELRAVSTLEEAQEAMGIDWMIWDELREAISPAMTELIGHQLMQHIRAEQAA
jgi:DNA (cytosine-5)-methyltransferase 1